MLNDVFQSKIILDRVHVAIILEIQSALVVESRCVGAAAVLLDCKFEHDNHRPAEERVDLARHVVLPHRLRRCDGASWLLAPRQKQHRRRVIRRCIFRFIVSCPSAHLDFF